MPLKTHKETDTSIAIPMMTSCTFDKEVSNKNMVFILNKKECHPVSFKCTSVVWLSTYLSVEKREVQPWTIANVIEKIMMLFNR